MLLEATKSLNYLSAHMHELTEDELVRLKDALATEDAIRNVRPTTHEAMTWTRSPGEALLAAKNRIIGMGRTPESIYVMADAIARAARELPPEPASQVPSDDSIPF